MQAKATRQVESGQQHPYLPNVTNRQPVVIQCAYDLDAVSFQDVEISMIRRDMELRVGGRQQQNSPWFAALQNSMP